MIPGAGRAIAGLWILWLGYWVIASRNTKPARRREDLVRRFFWHLTFVAGAILLALPDHGTRWFDHRFLPRSAIASAIGVLIVTAGLALAVWARRHLGRNWSGEVMVKVEHALVTSGPYRWVRHPIYSGMTLALIGTALASGTISGFLGLALIFFAFLVRVRQEEALMRQTFPAEYPAYSRRTARLVPGLY
jgi:protein-S-isoprenylcysteine O-methyltransferase Ste14